MNERPPATDYLADFARHGSATAFVTRRGLRNVRMTYLEIAEAASQFGHELAARKIDRGDRVVIWGENAAEWVVAFLGSIQFGAVAVPLDALATADIAGRILREVSAALLVCSARFAKLFSSAVHEGMTDGASQPAPGGSDSTASCLTDHARWGVPIIELETLLETIARHPRSRLSVSAHSPADPMEIIFTSGSTSEPRGVVITHGNMQANLAPFKPEIQKYLKYERFFHPIGFLNLVPLSHVFGQFMGIFVPPLLGGTVHFLDALNPPQILQTIRRERISALVTVPRIVESLRHKIERDVAASGQGASFQRDFDAAADEPFFRRWWRFRRLHLRMGWKFWALVCGGAALDRETETFWSRLGFVIAQGYGLTETASLISVNHPFNPQSGSVGQVMPGQTVKLGEHGEILVRGENVAAAYWSRNELAPVLSEDGWFHTGDVGEIDSGGRLYFKGRRKRAIVTAEGMNVVPEDLEVVLRRQPEVKECVVVGLDREGNSVPCAVLILTGPDANPTAAVKRANASLAPYQQIRYWNLWPDDDFPRTSTLKPRLSEIEARVRREARAARLGLDASPASGTYIGSRHSISTLAVLIERASGRKVPADSAANLATDLNLSSMERVELLSAIEDRYQLELDDAQFSAAVTLGDLERLIRGGASESVPRQAAGSASIATELCAAESGHMESHSEDSGGTRPQFTFPRWAQSWPANGIRALLYYLLVWPATMLLGKPRVVGREHLRGLAGPVLVVANHVFMIDVGYVLAALSFRFRHRLTVAMDGERIESFHRPPVNTGFVRRLIEKSKYYLITMFFNVYPLPQKAGFRSSFAYAGQSADRGFSVLVFPEGERTRTGEMGAFRPGIGILAAGLGIPVVPIYLAGLYQFKGRHFAPPHAITVRIGSPVTFAAGTDAAIITKDLEARLAALSVSSL